MDEAHRQNEEVKEENMPRVRGYSYKKHGKVIHVHGYNRKKGKK